MSRFEQDRLELGDLVAAWLSVQNNGFDNLRTIQRLAEPVATPDHVATVN